MGSHVCGSVHQGMSVSGRAGLRQSVPFSQSRSQSRLPAVPHRCFLPAVRQLGACALRHGPQQSHQQQLHRQQCSGRKVVTASAAATLSVDGGNAASVKPLDGSAPVNSGAQHDLPWWALSQRWHNWWDLKVCYLSPCASASRSSHVGLQAQGLVTSNVDSRIVSLLKAELAKYCMRISAGKRRLWPNLDVVGAVLRSMCP